MRTMCASCQRSCRRYRARSQAPGTPDVTMTASFGTALTQTCCLKTQPLTKNNLINLIIFNAAQNTGFSLKERAAARSGEALLIVRILLALDGKPDIGLMQGQTT